jgi:hypothetical protein
VARGVDEPAVVPLVPRVDDLVAHDLHEVKIVLTARLIRP